MTIVSNTGPLLHLSEAHALPLLRLAGHVTIPGIVEVEVKKYIPTWQTPDWITVERLTEKNALQASVWQQADLLDIGEAEALILARQLNAEWFLTDDTAARLLAQTLNTEVHGSLGVVLWAAAVGHLARLEAEQTLERLSQSSLWLSPKILAEARKALAAIFQ